MASENTLEVLNQIAQILNYSLAVYLSDAKPYVTSRDQEAERTLESIAQWKRETASRISREITEADGALSAGKFPLSFTALHDLSLDYLWSQLIEHQRRDVEAIERCVERLGFAPRAKALAEETLGAEKAHLDTLRETRSGESIGT